MFQPPLFTHINTHMSLYFSVLASGRYIGEISKMAPSCYQKHTFQFPFPPGHH